MYNKFTYIDLFAGIGGFKMALDAQGGKSKGFSEIEKDAIAAYTDNFGSEASENLGDITTIDTLPAHDILVAGVPCQSWSIAGRNLGFDDDRGQLWNDTLFLLNKSKPRCFIFENVKGLADPRNSKALSYIMKRIKEAGYHADYFVLNSYDYGVPQNRIRIYIIGFREEHYLERFNLPEAHTNHRSLSRIFDSKSDSCTHKSIEQLDFLRSHSEKNGGSISKTNGFNDYFLFNDIRNGKTTIHSWDILDTSERQKEICLLLLKNRRKPEYGLLDGNPLSLKHFEMLDSSIKKSELDSLVEIGILKEVEYEFSVDLKSNQEFSEQEQKFLNELSTVKFSLDQLKTNKYLKVNKISIARTIDSLILKNVVSCTEIRYEFKNTKISSGLFGVNRIFMPSAKLFSTLVASDTNDFIATEQVVPVNDEQYKRDFLEKIYFNSKYRKISKQEACALQGFPKDFKLPENRARWMKLIGNSVSVPVIEMLVQAIKQTDVFNSETFKSFLQQENS